MTEPGLSETAYRSLLDLNQQMHECRSVGELQTCLTENVSNVIWCDLVTFNTIDGSGSSRRTRLIISPPISDADKLVPAFDRYMYQHPLVEASLRTGEGPPRRITDLVDIDEFKQTELYKNVFKPLGVTYQLAFAVHSNPGMAIGIALNRATKDFTESEVTLAQFIYEQIPAVFHHVQLSELHERESQLADAPSLSDREREILVYLRAGLSNTDIARSLSLGRRTVEKHLERIYAKLGVTNRTAAVMSVWPSES